MSVLRFAIFALCLMGCGTSGVLTKLTGLAFTQGGNIITCAADVKSEVDQALADGKVNTGKEVLDWFSFVAEHAECIGVVAEGVIQAFQAPSTVAQNVTIGGDTVALPSAVPSEAKVRRATVALAMCKSMGVCK